MSPARASFLAYLAIFAGAWPYGRGPEFPRPDYDDMPFAPSFSERIERLEDEGRLEPLEARPAGGSSSWRVALEPDALGDPWVLLAEGRGAPATRHLMALARLDADLDLRVHLRAEGGESNRGGGLFWRAQGPDDTYLAYWDALAGEVRVERVLRGVRQELGRQRVAADPDAWHELRVSMIGRRMRIGFDGRLLGTLEDRGLVSVGQCGPWIAGDAVTCFGDLETVGKPSYGYCYPWN